MFNKKLLYRLFLGLFLISLGFAVSWRVISSACSKSLPSGYKIFKKDSYKKLLEHHDAYKINLKTDDCGKLAGVLVVRPNPKGVLLICHGYRQSKESLYSLLDIFKDYSIFLIDFRSHGSSSDCLISFGLHESKDVVTACDFLKADPRTSGLPVFGLGMSMACYALLKAQYEHGYFKALILDSGFLNLEAQLTKKFKRFTNMPNFMAKFCKNIFQFMVNASLSEMSPGDIISKIKIPVFIIHTDNDDIVSVDDAYRLFDLANDKKEIWIVKDSSHVKIFKDYPDLYSEKVKNFLDKV